MFCRVRYLTAEYARRGRAWSDAEGKKTFVTNNPANGEALATCADAGRADVDLAVKAAWNAFPAWKKTSPAERAALLMKIADLINANTERLAMVETLDNGKPIRETTAIDMPLSSDRFRCFAGVINVLSGRGSIADAAARHIIPATLELGGKSANIYFPDAPWEKALEGLQLGILFNQGQVCCAGSRVFVHESIYDRFLEEAVQAFSKIKVGLPWEADTIMGSQISESQLKKILDYVDIGQKEGARVAREKIFGPVACCLKLGMRTR